MNRKGFTLIELLAVVIILLAISVISIASISAVVERNKERQNETKKQVMIEHAKLYYDQYKNSGVFFEYEAYCNEHPSDCYVEIYLSDLDLSDEEKRDADGNYFCGYIKYYTVQTEKTSFVEDNTKCGDMVQP